MQGFEQQQRYSGPYPPPQYHGYQQVRDVREGTAYAVNCSREWTETGAGCECCRALHLGMAATLSINSTRLPSRCTISSSLPLEQLRPAA